MRFRSAASMITRVSVQAAQTVVTATSGAAAAKIVLKRSKRIVPLTIAKRQATADAMTNALIGEKRAVTNEIDAPSRKVVSAAAHHGAVRHISPVMMPL